MNVNVCQFVCVCASFPFCFKGGMWPLIVLISDHCLYFYFTVIAGSLLVSIYTYWAGIMHVAILSDQLRIYSLGWIKPLKLDPRLKMY